MTTPVQTRSRTRRTLVVLIVAAILGGLAWYLASGSASESGARAESGSVIEEFEVDERTQAEPFTARMLSGSKLDTSTLRGTVQVYNVWGSWCVPCATEAPDLVEVANQFATQVTFVGLNIRDNNAAAKAFEREYDVPYDSVVSEDSAQATLSFQGALSAAAVPTTLVLDRQGRIAARAIGPVSAATLRSLITPVLAETDASTRSSR